MVLGVPRAPKVTPPIGGVSKKLKKLKGEWAEIALNVCSC